MTTGFFGRVYRLVRQTPPGKVTSYGAIARMLGYPRAARIMEQLEGEGEAEGETPAY